MHKEIHSIDSYDISEEEYLQLYNQPAAQMVVEAVRRYNEVVSQAVHLTDKVTDARLIKEAEEEDAKAFLDRVFDIIQKAE